MTSSHAVTETKVPGYPRRQGKVRDVYDLGDSLVLVATDRLSAFDWVLPTPIPDKGKILTQLSNFWFDFLGEPNHLISTKLTDLPPAFRDHPEIFDGRSVLVKKTEVIPIECVARGYLVGSGWKEYLATGRVCGIELPKGLKHAAKLPEPIFTPATKADFGHDENISEADVRSRIGDALTDELKKRTLRIYDKASRHAAERGVILADTKFEFGASPAREGGEILLIDEALTPDSSRFWPADSWKPGENPPSFDKQFVRDWLESINYDKSTPPPTLPEDVVTRTREKYVEAYERVTGRSFAC
jgi:phosphoribosylaminoimidazole-succinocarboxamide synthase